MSSQPPQAKLPALPTRRQPTSTAKPAPLVKKRSVPNTNITPEELEKELDRADHLVFAEYVYRQNRLSSFWLDCRTLLPYTLLINLRNVG